MDKKHLKVKTSQTMKAVGEAHAQIVKGSEVSVTGLKPESCCNKTWD